MMTNQNKNKTRFVFFGSSELSVAALEELRANDLLPVLIITSPDAKKGRGQKLSPSPVKVWAQKHAIEVLAPEMLDDAICEALRLRDAPFFLVVAYGKILPKTLLDIPQKGVLNIHPSLLPRFRGASPVRSAVLSDEHTGVSVMLLDEKMDHGPILAQRKVEPALWPPKAAQFELELIREGAKLLGKILHQWLSGEIEPQEQNHDIATYCGKIEKEDGLLDLSGAARQNLLKIRAYDGWPGTYTQFLRSGKKIRVQIIDAHLEDEKLVIDTVKPAGKKEIPYAEFLRSGATPL